MSTRPAPTSGRAKRRLRLGELLVAAGKATLADVQRAIVEQRARPGRRIGEILIANGVIDERALAETLAREFDLPFVDLATRSPPPELVALLPASVVLEHHVLPLEARGSTLVVAVGDPLDLEALDIVALHCSRPIAQVVAMPSQIEAVIASLLRTTRDLRAEIADRGGADIDGLLREVANAGLHVAPEGGRDAVPIDESHAVVIRLVNKILMDAFRRGASDVHVEPNGRDRPVLVRFRVDGECALYHELPAGLAAPVVARIKIMSELDIAERRKPQDGKMRLSVGDTPLELRVATVPTVGNNEDVVLRLLPPARPRALEEMALEARNLRELKALLAQPYGLVLCVGPTGSGKTTTLHSALGTLNRPSVKIWTVEDPVEITQPGLRQVQINRRAGVDFASTMRSFLRADPDVIMVGEMRDMETASMAVEASLTGHLVLSTLHTNSAPETIVRLLEIGLDPFGFADSLLGVLAQRLVRAICPRCRERAAPTPSERELLERTLGAETAAHATTWRGAGCEQCAGSGYKGRLAIHELLVVDDAIRGTIAHPKSIDVIRELAARTGMTTLLQDGVGKALAGLTDLREVIAACNR